MDSNPASVKVYAARLLIVAELKGINAELARLNIQESRNPDSALEKKAEKGLLRKSDIQNFRYTQPAKNSNIARLDFIYQGAMEAPKRLGSGEERYQLGVMLRQTNQCNLLYVMIRLGDEPTVVVQEKLNPGQSTHAQCQNHGYSTIASKLKTKLPEIKRGEQHLLVAEIKEEELEVSLDKRVVWQGKLNTKIQSGENIGFRSDNVKVDFDLTDVK